MSQLASGLLGIIEFVRSYQGYFINTAIIAATAAIEAIINIAIYFCPCVEKSELKRCVVDSDGKINEGHCLAKTLNILYGFSYFCGPAILLLLLGIVTSPKTLKLWTGSCKKKKSQRKISSCHVALSVLGRAVVAPITWVSMAFFSGDYYACMTTPLPYDLWNSEKEKMMTCQEMAKESEADKQYGDQYNDNRIYSQMIGWFVVAGCCLIGFIAYACSECNSPLTYYHAKYYKIYREQEEAEFSSEMKTKAKRDAEQSVRLFVSKPRKKCLWDKVSTVFSYEREGNLNSYSYLQQWVAENGLNEMSEIANESFEEEEEAV